MQGLFREDLEYFIETMLNRILASCVGADLTDLQSRLFTNLKHFIMTKTIRQEWEHFSFKGPAAPPQFPDIYRLMLKAEGMLGHSKHCPVPTSLGSDDVISSK